MTYLILISLFLNPAYSLRFNLLGLPANMLMAWIALVWLVFCYTLKKKGEIFTFASWLKKQNIAVGFFFIAGVVGLIKAGYDTGSLGLFLVLFLQPLSLYFIAKYTFEKSPASKNFLIIALYLALSALGLYAIIQYFTGMGLLPLFAGNQQEPRRALSIFGHPNFYALWSAPLLGFLIPDLGQKIKSLNKNKFWLMLWLIGAFGLLLSLSRSGWIGLFFALLTYIFFAGNKKTRLLLGALALVAGLTVYANPFLKERLTAPLQGEKSSTSRLTLWQSGIAAIKESPIFGLGLGGYAREYKRIIQDQSLPNHNYPHNIFLNFWTETGILGLFSVLIIIFSAIYKGLTDHKNLIGLSVAIFLITVLVQGQFDNPYFKNDLAVVFWLILSLI